MYNNIILIFIQSTTFFYFAISKQTTEPHPVKCDLLDKLLVMIISYRTLSYMAHGNLSIDEIHKNCLHVYILQKI